MTSQPSGGDWRVEEVTGSVADFHGRDLPDPVERTLWWQEPVGRTVVLGSTQADSVVDRAGAAAAGVAVVRRRSGGGAVWLAPGEVTWVDVVIPAGDPLWHDDVGVAAHWLGDAWARALRPWFEGPLDVHRSGLVRSRWSPLVCFAGLGPGEVTHGAAKVVGVSQRRTRAGARFQCAVIHHWNPRPLLDVMGLPPAERRTAEHDLAEAAVGIGPVPPTAVVEALQAQLRTT